jgi:hypothetical protein
MLARPTMKQYRLNKRFGRLISLLLIIVIAVSPILAQQKQNITNKPAQAPAPAPTFDTLLAADTYRIYCEVRGVGGLIRSSAVSDLLDPIMKLGGPPKEFKSLVTWLNKHSDTLAGSRLMIAGWASRPNIPNVVVAVEFSTPEEAKKFYPELRGFLPKLFPTPTPTPSPTPTPKPAESPRTTAKEPAVATTPDVVAVTTPQSISTVAEKDNAPPAPPYQVKQVGSLVLISDTAFELPALNPRGSKPLEEDQNFVMARNRFASESIFLYVDMNAIAKEDEARRKQYEEEEQKRIEDAEKNPPKEEQAPAIEESEMPSPEDQASPPMGEVMVDADQSTELVATVSPNSNEAPVSEPAQHESDELGYALYGAFFSGQSKWPEAIGAGLVFEGDSYVVRTLIINGPETKNNAIPFVPQFITGPAIAPESPNILPADTELFISVSVDYNQIYEGMLKSMAQAREHLLKTGRATVPEALLQESPFASYEKKLGIKIKDDLLPLLGNEFAFALPKKPAPSETPANSQPAEPKSGSQESPPVPVQNTNPVIAIAIKDREAVSKLIPKIIDGFGLKGASMLAQSEKRDGTEIVSYAGVFSYAFVGDFLVVSPDPREARRVVDAYLNHQTLSSDSHFRNSTRWQPRQVLGQLYMTPEFVEQYTTGGGSYGAVINEKTSEFLARVNPTIEPLTYVLTNDGLGPLHEIHLPKNLVIVQVVAMSAGSSEALPNSNESVAKSVLRNIGGAEASYRATENSYGSLDQLVKAGLISQEPLEKYGYKIEVNASKDKFEIIAIPLEYGQSGRLSYYLDESQILRGGDHGGGAATASDQPL